MRRVVSACLLLVLATACSTVAPHQAVEEFLGGRRPSGSRTVKSATDSLRVQNQATHLRVDTVRYVIHQLKVRAGYETQTGGRATVRAISRIVVAVPVHQLVASVAIAKR
jgi:hypothetical protein